ncbi:hypothetical protein L9F63_024299 [Diploptera punctata]|uniref:Uncharacterized protein n=1 Tax=Diploptera punctata TaxID=6984 RepID=A0AAD7ZHA5_DIPPU|nr:hypothetical protein L9F63_024299 [Diploptera punctata]
MGASGILLKFSILMCLFTVGSYSVSEYDNRLAFCVATVVQRYFAALHIVQISVSTTNSIKTMETVNYVLQELSQMSAWSLSFVSLSNNTHVINKLNGKSDVTFNFHGYIIFFPQSDKIGTHDEFFKYLKSIHDLKPLCRQARFLIILTEFNESARETSLIVFFEYLFKKFGITDVLIMVPTISEDEFCFYTCFPMKKTSFDYNEDDIYLIHCSSYKNNTNFVNNINLYPSKYQKNVSGRQLKVSVYVNNITSWYIRQVYKGIEIRLFEDICKILNVSIKYNPQGIPWKEYPTVINEVKDGIADIAIGSMTLVDNIIDYVEATIPFASIVERWYVPCPIQHDRIDRFIHIFDKWTWCMQLTIYVLFVIVLWIGNKITLQGTSGLNYVSNCLSYIFSIYTAVSVKQKPTSAILRTLFLLCVWYCSVYNLIFQSFFTTWLIDPGLKKQISNFEELMSSELEFGFKFDMNETYMKHFNNDGFEIDKRRFKTCNTLQECFRRTIKYKNYSTLTFDVIAENFVAINYPNQKNVLCTIEDNLSTGHIVFLLGKNSLYHESFTKLARRFVESGIISKRVDDFRNSLINTAEILEDNEEHVKYFVLELHHMIVAFTLLLLGYVLAFLTFIMEIIYRSLYCVE